jgi:hypothetical protein
MDNQQETLNIFIIYRGSSETARYTPIKKKLGEDTVQL